MDDIRFKEAHKWVKDELNRCTDFWLEHGWDKEHGGVYTCLDREGKVYSTDKSFLANAITITARNAFDVINMNKRGEKPESLTDANPSEQKTFDLVEQESLTRFDKRRGNNKRKKKKPVGPTAPTKETTNNAPNKEERNKEERNKEVKPRNKNNRNRDNAPKEKRSPNPNDKPNANEKA